MRQSVILMTSLGVKDANRAHSCPPCELACEKEMEEAAYAAPARAVAAGRAARLSAL
jgi:hypothetical protein